MCALAGQNSPPTWVWQQSPYSPHIKQPCLRSPPNDGWLEEKMPYPFGSLGNQPKCRWLWNISPTVYRAKFPAPIPVKRRAFPMETTQLPTLTDSGLVMMTDVLWKTLTRTTGPYFLALEIKVPQRRLSATGEVISLAQVQMRKRVSPPRRGLSMGLGLRLCPVVDSQLSHLPPWASVSTSIKIGLLHYSTPKGCAGNQAISCLWKWFEKGKSSPQIMTVT